MAMAKMIANPAAYVKTGEPLDAALLKQLVPATDRVVRLDLIWA
jgi:hypothetical protein